MRLIDADVLEPDADYDDGDYWAVSMAQIQNAPTIEERKTGKWIYTPTEPLGYICSECKKGCCRYNFCPNCGAKMEGAGSEDIPMEYFESGGR